MSVLASDVMDRSRVWLNDQAARRYTNTILLPVLKSANDEFGDILINNNIPVQKEISSEITVLAGATTLTLPNDIIAPISLFEKTSGEADSFYTEITQKIFEPNIIPGPNLVYYSWREQEIKFPASSRARVVKMYYYKLLTVITSASSVMTVSGSLNFLSYKVAELAYRHMAKNNQDADVCLASANKALMLQLGISIKGNQGTPVRRRAFRIGRKTSVT